MNYSRPPLPNQGRCTLVNTGPGSPEMLSLQAIKAIQAATVLMVDDLVSSKIVACAAPTARIVHMGQRGGCKSTPQTFIEQLMVLAVREGENVVRLKGSHQSIGGHAGDELEQLKAADIHVSVINAMAAWAP